MSNHYARTPIDTDLQSILLAAGVEQWTELEWQRARAVLINVVQSAHGKITRGQARWRMRATILRNRYEPSLTWDDVDRDPTV